jgi:hypothetical protein
MAVGKHYCGPSRDHYHCLVISHMKNLLLSALLGLASLVGHAAPFDFGKLHHRGAPDMVSKPRLVQLLGPPARITQPNYECGALSAREQSRKFYSLHYGLATFTGNATDSYQLDAVKFAAGSQPLHYSSHAWSAATTINDLREVFGADLKLAKQPRGQLLASVSSKKGEDGAVFIFKNGHLVEFQHWSPC